MSEWAAKRFWKAASVSEDGQGFEILLDDRPLRTPAKTPLIVPTRPMAEAIASEWDAQDEQIDPLSMPTTRSANAAIDKVKPQAPEVVDLIAAYGDSDLVCYRSDGPEELVARQNAGWDPLLDWGREALGVSMRPVAGLMYQAQSQDDLEKLHTHVTRLSAFQLTGFHDLVSLSGSLLIGLAAIYDQMSPEKLWEISRIDEEWQISQWGNDEEAAQHAANKRAAFLHGHLFYTLST